MADATPHEPESEHAHAAYGAAPHVVPLGVLLGVFAALIVLTYLTVAATHFDLGLGNLAIAMGIATVKAALVGLYFMHLRYDSAFFSLLFAAGIAFLAMFILFTLMDTLEYQPDTNPWAQPAAVSGERSAVKGREFL